MKILIYQLRRLLIKVIRILMGRMFQEHSNEDIFKGELFVPNHTFTPKQIN